MRRGISASIDVHSPHRIVLRVTNNNGAIIDAVGVALSLSRPVARVRIRPDHVSTPSPEPILQPGRSEVVLPITRLKPQQTRVFHIDLFDDEPTRP